MSAVNNPMKVYEMAFDDGVDIRDQLAKCMQVSQK